jgi:hypothetical protein
MRKYKAVIAATGVFLCTGVLCAQDTAVPQKVPVHGDIPVPEGYTRIHYPTSSFSCWMQSLPLKRTKEISLYNGKTLSSLYNVFYYQFNVFAVVDMPLLFTSDLEQCADFCMRMWAEYHRAAGTLDKFYLFDYNGQKKPFVSSGKSFKQFLKWAFAGTNSHSLKKGCAEVKEEELMPGDMFVQNQSGGIGHASMIVDMCESKTGEKLCLIGYSFMPAQEFHIEKAPDDYGNGGWFTLKGCRQFLMDSFDYGPPVLRRFKPL